MSNTVAQLMEHSSREDPEAPADPLMLLYRTLEVHTPDIARVVLSIHDIRVLAHNMDPTLTPYLIKDVHGYDLAIASLLSVNGKGLKYLTTETKSFNLTERSNGQSFKMKDLVSGQDQGGAGFNMADND